ncbi:MAG: ATP-binding cassette domain-containing protein [Candidatus Delongbacteria bacterium]|nr:ATP-binding cassette domain-containing protein [Candidatus Delongbacteria bacterium]MCG2760416.1 ATP-binding cassette domain-containing protein [Candidatus Delongbacteria bacterium]
MIDVGLKNIKKAYGAFEILTDVSFDIKTGDKIGLIGRNGSGKTTLLKIILDQIEADAGEAVIGSSVKTAYLDQNIQFDDMENNVLNTYKEFCKVYEGEARNALANFLFTRDEVFKKVKELSGGEKTRLKLALLMQTDTNLLILDEPTNHLDIDSKEMLEEALNSFKGTILFVSHDRYFINQISNRIVELSEDGANSYEGDYDYYKECVAKKQSSTFATAQIKEKKVKPVVKKRASNKFKLEQTEKEIEEIEEKINSLNKNIEDSPDEYEMVAENYQKIKNLEARLEELYEIMVEI